MLYGADPHIMKSKDALTGCTLEIARLIESDPQGWKILGSTKNVECWRKIWIQRRRIYGMQRWQHLLLHGKRLASHRPISSIKLW